MPASSMRAADSSVIISLRSTRSGGSSPFLTLTRGSGSGAAASRPTRRRWKAPFSSLDSERMIQLPSSVPQSSSRVMTSCATSTRRRVRYPESAVRRAVSARPLRAPWVRDEVLEDGHPLAEVAPHGDVDDPAGRVGHQAAHGAQLADVALVPAGARRGHHRDRAGRVERLHHLVRHLGRGLLPDPDDLLVALVLGDEAALELASMSTTESSAASSRAGLVLRDLDVEEADGHAAAGGELEADALDAVDEVRRLLGAELAVAARRRAP